MAIDAKHEAAMFYRARYGAPLSDSDDTVIQAAHEMEPDQAVAFTRDLLNQQGTEEYAEQHPAINAVDKAGEAVQGAQKAVGSALEPIEKAMESVSNGYNQMRVKLNAASPTASKALDVATAPTNAGLDAADAVGKVGKFAMSGYKMLGDSLAEVAGRAQSAVDPNGSAIGVAGAALGAGMDTAAGSILPQSRSQALLAALLTPTGAEAGQEGAEAIPGDPGLSGAPEAYDGELAHLREIRQHYKNGIDNEPNGGGLADTEMTSTAQNASDKTHFGDDTGDNFEAQPQPEMVGKSPAQGLKDMLNQRIQELEGKPATPGIPPMPAVMPVGAKSPFAHLYNGAKEVASDLAEGATDKLLQWFPRVDPATARKLAADPDMVNRAVSLDTAKGIQAEWAQEHGLVGGTEGMDYLAEKSGSSNIDYLGHADDTYNELKGVGANPTQEEAQKALIGRQAYAEALKNKWKNPSKSFEDQIVLKRQAHLDGIVERYAPDYKGVRQVYSEAATVDKLNSALPRNQNMTPSKLQLTATLAGAYETALRSGLAHGAVALGAGLASQSPLVWKQLLKMAGVAGRDVGGEALKDVGTVAAQGVMKSPKSNDDKEGWFSDGPKF